MNKMSLFGKLRTWLFPNNRKNLEGQVIFVFASTGEVIRAESTLKAQGYEVKVMGPPPEIREGCDMVIAASIVEEPGILRALQSAKTAPLSSVRVEGPLLKPVELVHIKDFGDFLMVRAANMKITVEKSSRLIVNISGGGCPDVPYLAAKLVGINLDQAPAPRETGYTLCAYALQIAYEEIIRRCSV